jgi:oxygen-independent coproporphyrinogen-3 oxidase
MFDPRVASSLGEEAPGFGVYVHWPYCAAICPYCDFNVYRARDRDPGPLLAAIEADIAGWRARTGPQTVTSVFLGGGTPSLLAPAEVGRILSAIDRAWGLPAGVEITLEANPEDADPVRFAGFVAAGVERLSLGVQALDDHALKRLGRWHSAGDARRAIDVAVAAAPRVSVDLIVARADQTLDDVARELSQVIAAGVGHLSLYHLTLEPGTAYARRAARGEALALDPDRAADVYDLTAAVTAAAGLPAYEISNHARTPADQSRHNLGYWRSGEWAGVGPGAHGRLGPAEGADRRATEAARTPEAYIAAVAAGGWGVVADEPLDRAARTAEVVLMGLRLVEGLDRRQAEVVRGAAFSPAVVAELVADGVLEAAPDRLRLTADGRRLADAVARRLLGA